MYDHGKEINDMPSMWSANSDLDYYGQFNPEPPEDEEPEELEPEEDEQPEPITEAEAFEALAEEAGDRAYDMAEEDRLFPATIGPFPAPPVQVERPLRLPPQQGKLFKTEVA
jgi:hypothetical protein